MGPRLGMLDELLRDFAKESAPLKYPSGYYSHEGDCVFVYNEGGEYIRQRVDGLLTLFRAPDDGRIIGLQIKGVKAEQVIGVSVTHVAASSKSRIDTVDLLLRSYERELPGGEREERRSAYVDALRAFAATPAVEVN